MSTTYILGAGASKAVWGFPLLRGFLADCGPQLAELRYEQGKEGLLEEYVRWRFGPLDDANLEDILSDLDQALFGFGSMWYGPKQKTIPSRLRSELLDVIRERLAIDQADKAPTPDLSPYRAVIDAVQDEDFIVTLNYDCGVERFVSSSYCSHKGPLQPYRIHRSAGEILGDVRGAMCALPLVGNAFLARDVPFLLKLHGSTNYFACCNSSCPTWHRIYLAEYIGNPIDCICLTCGGFLEAVIIPPTMSKSFDRYPKLAMIWRLAERSLRECDRIVVWGFSCPPTDHHFAWLLRNSCRKRTLKDERDFPLRQVVVVDPDCENVADRLKYLIDPTRSVEWRLFKSHAEYAAPGPAETERRNMEQL